MERLSFSLKLGLQPLLSLPPSVSRGNKYVPKLMLFQKGTEKRLEHNACSNKIVRTFTSKFKCCTLRRTWCIRWVRAGHQRCILPLDDG